MAAEIKPPQQLPFSTTLSYLGTPARRFVNIPGMVIGSK